MKAYRRSSWFHYLLFTIAGLLAAFAIAGPLLLATGEDASSLVIVVFIGLFYVAMAGVVAWYAATIPHELRITDDGTIEFRSYARMRRVAVDAIVSIKPASRIAPGWVYVRYAGGKKIRLMTQFDGFYDFIATVKEMNPNIELRGV